VKNKIKFFLLIGFFGLILIHPMGLNVVMSENKYPHMPTETAYFAGGCFWCMEPVFDAIEGVVDTTVGYMGGIEETANYNDVSSGRTNHFEAVQVTYVPDIVSYKALLRAFWQSIDPTDAEGQFADKGRHYQTAIFLKRDSDRAIVEASIKELLSKKSYEKPIATKLLPESSFYKAEAYHQNYYQKNSVHYNAYKIGSGRAGYLKKAWGKDEK
jgi:methionine-S-sulfoxide reductase